MASKIRSGFRVLQIQVPSSTFIRETLFGSSVYSFKFVASPETRESFTYMTEIHRLLYRRPFDPDSLETLPDSSIRILVGTFKSPDDALGWLEWFVRGEAKFVTVVRPAYGYLLCLDDLVSKHGGVPAIDFLAGRSLPQRAREME